MSLLKGGLSKLISVKVSNPENIRMKRKFLLICPHTVRISKCNAKSVLCVDKWKDGRCGAPSKVFQYIVSIGLQIKNLSPQRDLNP